MFNLMDAIGLHVVAAIKKYRTEFGSQQRGATRRSNRLSGLYRPAGGSLVSMNDALARKR
jgi:hypothetical protein